MAQPLSSRELLEWYLEAGVDETIGDAPVNRYLDPPTIRTAASAARNSPPPAPTRPRGSRGRPPHTVSGGPPPVAPRGVGKAFPRAAIASASPPADETGKALG